MAYSSEVKKLAKDVEELRKRLIESKVTNRKEYVESIEELKRKVEFEDPRERNPILKKLQNPDLSLKERVAIKFPTLYPSEPSDIYYQWVAPSRLPNKKSKEWWIAMTLFALIVILVAIIIKQIIFIAVLFAFLFFTYASSYTPIRDQVYKLTRQGIEIGEGPDIDIYAWDQLLDFAFYYRNETECIYIDTIFSSPGKIIILFNQEDRKNIYMILSQHLPYKPPPIVKGINGFLTQLFDGIYISLEDFKELQNKIDEYYNKKYAYIIAKLQKEGKLSSDITVEKIRMAEDLSRLKLIESIQKQEEETLKRVLGIK
ncbi:MAG: hypothetical protein N3A71_01895 [Candidatus Dojkabacteria bacterium]|nr:hypothetical protein [Candidatus Dojkabacteria bacterium]